MSKRNLQNNQSVEFVLENGNVNWKNVFADRHTEGWYKRFANGDSARSLERAFRNTGNAGPFRKLLRSKGVDGARTLVKRALSRRQSSERSRISS